jgi:ubiquinone/menaquinone biosynthesis C-methylase UbiE
MAESQATQETEKLKCWLRELVDIPKNGLLVDLGSGKGDDLAQLAEDRPEAEFIGLDIIPPSLDNKTDRTRFVAADLSHSIPLQSESVDALYSVNLIECIPDKGGFLRECARVLKPSGTILLAHFDWDTQTFDGTERGPVRKILHAFNDWQQGWMKDIDPWAGRRLYRYAQECGAFTGEIHAHTLISTSFEPGSYARNQADSLEALVRRGMVEQAEYEEFVRFQQALASRNAFFYSVTIYAFAGRRG